MKTAKMTKQSKRPTYAELTEQRDNLRRKVALLRTVLHGEAMDLEFANACGITGAETPEARMIRCGALIRCATALDYVMMGEG